MRTAAVSMLGALAAVLCWAPGAGAQTFGNCDVPPALTATIPTVPGTGQADFNCYAWQEFIALNWAADPSTCAADPDATAASFGDPASTAPVVWQTYKAPEEVFLAGARAPAAWCAVEPGARSAREPYGLSAVNKFDAAAPLDLGDFHEASPSDSWLTAQSKLLTLYDIRINEDEFDYIVSNELYDADTQQTFAVDPGIDLPDETDGKTKTGSIELKAAWLELDDPADFTRFLTTKATVTYPGGQPKPVTVGLVGLHIIHQTSSAQQFAWATFEHVDNAPSAADVKSGKLKPAYTYFDPKCDPSTDPYNCEANPAQDPKTDPYDAPVQVVRQTPLQTGNTNPIVGLNTDVQAMIAAANADSVFRNYELVNVLWPESGFDVPAGSRVPLGNGQAQPVAPDVVANTTLETYVQDKMCLDCHTFAPIAKPRSQAALTVARVSDPVDPKIAADAPYAADYSFLLHRAQSAPSAGGATSSTLLAAAIGGAALVLAGAGAAVVRRRRRTT